MHGLDAHEAGTRVVLPANAREEIEGIAAGAEVDPFELVAVNARTEVLAGSGASECSVIATDDALAQNWDWNPDCGAATVIWGVRHEAGWLVTLTEAGMLSKIGLNESGLGVCVNILHSSIDGGMAGTPIHVLLRHVLSRCESVDAAVDLLTQAKVSASRP